MKKKNPTEGSQSYTAHWESGSCQTYCTGKSSFKFNFP